jgi:hypothetical protein
MKGVRVLFLATSILALVGCGAATATPRVSSSTLTAVDVAAAQRAALTMFVEFSPGHWGPCLSSNNYAGCPLSPTVKARLAALTSRGYFYSGPSGHCTGDFISNSTNGLFNAPEVLSAEAESNGTVTVVIQRVTSIPDLTAVMTKGNDTWLATDLASGTGSSASIFSAEPNC